MYGGKYLRGMFNPDGKTNTALLTQHYCHIRWKEP
jgi:hypothetical protein